MHRMFRVQGLRGFIRLAGTPLHGLHSTYLHHQTGTVTNLCLPASRLIRTKISPFECLFRLYTEREVSYFTLPPKTVPQFSIRTHSTSFSLNSCASRHLGCSHASRMKNLIRPPPASHCPSSAASPSMSDLTAISPSAFPIFLIIFDSVHHCSLLVNSRLAQHRRQSRSPFALINRCSALNKLRHSNCPAASAELHAIFINMLRIHGTHLIA